MPSDYPAPAHAAYIWLAGDTIWLGFPGTGPAGRGSQIHLSADEFGIRNVLAVLRNRERTPQAKIATPGVPLQAMIDALARSTVQPKVRPNPAGLKLRDLFPREP